MLHMSNPKPTVIDMLSKLSHDGDPEVAQGAIMSLGFVGSGTNNSRIALQLRNLSTYWGKDANTLFVVRLAQGMLHMGKGLMTLSPTYSDRLLTSPTALAGILTVMHSCLDLKGIILGQYHYMLYMIAPAMQPRMLVTLDQDLKPLPVSVRVGQVCLELLCIWNMKVISFESFASVYVTVCGCIPGRRCGGSGRQAQVNHRICYTHDAGARGI